MVLLVSQQVLIYGIYSNTVHFVFLYIYDKSRCQFILITWFRCVKNYCGSPWGPRSAIFGPYDLHPMYYNNNNNISMSELKFDSGAPPGGQI